MARTRKPAPIKTNITWYPPKCWITHIAHCFQKSFAHQKIPPWANNAKWTDMMLGKKETKRSDGIFGKIAKEMYLYVDHEFMRDQVWWMYDEEQYSVLGGENIWRIYAVVEVENNWSTIQTEINQLFHLRASLRIGVFYPPSSITIEDARDSVERSIPKHSRQVDDEFLMILIPENDSMPRYFKLKSGDPIMDPIMEELDKPVSICDCYYCR